MKLPTVCLGALALTDAIVAPQNGEKVCVGLGNVGRIFGNIKRWCMSGVADYPFMYSRMSSIIFSI